MAENKTPKKKSSKSKMPTKVSDLIPDDKNFNLGNPFGEGLIEKSFGKFGAGRGVLIDKHNRLIAGNKSTQKFVEGGGEKIIVVETTGDTLVVTKRTDIDLDTAQGREMALADNATAKANIVFDAELVAAEVGEAVAEEWGIDTGVKNEGFGEDFSLNDGDKAPFQQMTFTLADAQAEKIKDCLKKATKTQTATHYGNENSNGNALRQRKLKRQRITSNRIGMGRAKEIVLKVIPSTIANEFIRTHHYSGKVVKNSNLHFGAFLDNKLHGVLSYGSPLDKRKVLPLVQPSLWNEMLELNRMAFDEYLPKNSESRCISISIRLIKKNAPHIKWILSFADGTQCGYGAIYRASGFFLTGIVENSNTCQLPNGEVIHKMTLESNPTSPRRELGGKSYYGLTDGKYDFRRYVKEVRGKVLVGYQLRYVYVIDTKSKITVPIIPFERIKELGAEMYKGQKITRADVLNKSSLTSSQEMAVTPTSALN